MIGQTHGCCSRKWPRVKKISFVALSSLATCQGSALSRHGMAKDRLSCKFLRRDVAKLAACAWNKWASNTSDSKITDVRKTEWFAKPRSDPAPTGSTQTMSSCTFSIDNLCTGQQGHVVLHNQSSCKRRWICTVSISVLPVEAWVSDVILEVRCAHPSLSRNVCCTGFCGQRQVVGF